MAKPCRPIWVEIHQVFIFLKRKIKSRGGVPGAAALQRSGGSPGAALMTPDPTEMKIIEERGGKKLIILIFLEGGWRGRPALAPRGPVAGRWEAVPALPVSPHHLCR